MWPARLGGLPGRLAPAPTPKSGPGSPNPSRSNFIRPTPTASLTNTGPIASQTNTGPIAATLSTFALPGFATRATPGSTAAWALNPPSVPRHAGHLLFHVNRTPNLSREHTNCLAASLGTNRRNGITSDVGRQCSTARGHGDPRAQCSQSRARTETHAASRGAECWRRASALVHRVSRETPD